MWLLGSQLLFFDGFAEEEFDNDDDDDDDDDDEVD